jgi:hypothetical protein
VEQFHGSAVWGILYSISQEELRQLNDGEKGYTPVRITMRVPDGIEEQCWLHLADRVQDGLRPYSWYKRFLVEGARAHGLPADYIATLEAIEASEDPDRDRDRRRRAITCAL